MSNLDEIETVVSELPPDKLAEFREWFVQFDAQNWDDQIAANAGAGRLDEGARRAPGRADPATMNHFATRSP